jgi:hypothetical protein|eukprot:CAMPEP_0174306768 /NCGR_PEP_ID=MMETSP0810-20121108/674_1 /TAXON_ID=73025 ORGANISM="Eutreptiella gymnastica-like, Strain CCMP1594" /NCGR_SAMPLE_ID=MMETSP0810 /ASSEMBLY_ACC=CAM_ASM_000659 /LENGTH=213 /DNA_ID=CAMNT_0015413599 /DNA_START=12 /DNA_END=653 /DNA_ORIENTATION=+
MATDPAGAPKAPKPKDPKLEAMKEACTRLYREPAYDENHQDYIIGDFRWSTKKIVNVTSTQVYRGLADEDDKPHGWGLMQHHNGISHDCARWEHGVPNGRGVFRDPEGGAFYGEWVNGKRHGLGCSINKLHQMLIEQYEHGQLQSKTKWKIDKEHLRCAHCNCLYMEATNKLECRYHPDGVDWEDRFTCCGALQKHNPQGCAVDYHRQDPRPK